MSKQEIIAEILENKTYSQDSGFIKVLTEKLSKLSSITLSDLHVLISLKIAESKRRS